MAHDLDKSLPTVSKALATLEAEGLITRNGTFPSSGGRPAVAYEFCPEARLSLGMELVADNVNVAVLDLYGHVLHQHTRSIVFEHTEAYAQRIAQLLEGSVRELGIPCDRLLGATIAIQGIVSADGRVTFGGLLGADSADVSLGDFADKVAFPLRLVHDAEAAAYAEAWRHGGLSDFAYLSLNDHLGTALIRDGRLVQRDCLGAGVAEHMTIIPHGDQCYCGNHGCFETVLGARVLQQQARMSVSQFFDAVRDNDGTAKRRWHTYLDYLAMLIHNLRMTTCGNIVIGGRLARYMTQADLRILRMKSMDKGALSTYPFHLALGQYGDMATVIGAGVMTIGEFLMPS